MDPKKERQRIIKSAKNALKELDKVINQNIDLGELDPEKAKAAVQGKIESIEGSLKILNVIAEIEAMDADASKSDEKAFLGVESILNNKK